MEFIKIGVALQKPELPRIDKLLKPITQKQLF
jgi:hypothetical protein